MAPPELCTRAPRRTPRWTRPATRAGLQIARYEVGQHGQGSVESGGRRARYSTRPIAITLAAPSPTSTRAADQASVQSDSRRRTAILRRIGRNSQFDCTNGSDDGRAPMTSNGTVPRRFSVHRAVTAGKLSVDRPLRTLTGAKLHDPESVRNAAR